MIGNDPRNGRKRARVKGRERSNDNMNYIKSNMAVGFAI